MKWRKSLSFTLANGGSVAVMKINKLSTFSTIVINSNFLLYWNKFRSNQVSFFTIYSKRPVYWGLWRNIQKDWITAECTSSITSNETKYKFFHCMLFFYEKSAQASNRRNFKEVAISSIFICFIFMYWPEISLYVLSYIKLANYNYDIWVLKLRLDWFIRWITSLSA